LAKLDTRIIIADRIKKRKNFIINSPFLIIYVLFDSSPHPLLT